MRSIYIYSQIIRRSEGAAVLTHNFRWTVHILAFHITCRVWVESGESLIARCVRQ